MKYLLYNKNVRRVVSRCREMCCDENREFGVRVDRCCVADLAFFSPLPTGSKSPKSGTLRERLLRLRLEGLLC
jgi:hypothetical protein